MGDKKDPMEPYYGTWIFDYENADDDDAKNLEAYLLEFKVGFFYRKLMRMATPRVKFRNTKSQPGKYFFITKSKGLVSKRFALGPWTLNEAIDEVRADGTKFKSTFSIDEDGRLIQEQIGDKVSSKTVRIINEKGQLVGTATCNGVTISRRYNKIEDDDSADEET